MSTEPAPDLVSIVLLEAAFASITPFVPLPFVDDYLFERLLRRVARKVLERAGARVDDAFAKGLVDAYVKAGDRPLGEKALTAAARFVIRKVAVVLDVKKGHDVFGQAIAFALALDSAVQRGVVRTETIGQVGAAIHRALESVGSGPIELLTGAARQAFAVERGSIAERARNIGGAIGRHVDETRRQLESAMQRELEVAGLG